MRRRNYRVEAGICKKQCLLPITKGELFKKLMMIINKRNVEGKKLHSALKNILTSANKSFLLAN